MPKPYVRHNGKLFDIPLKMDNRGIFVQMNHLPLCDDTNGVVGIDCIYTAAITEGHYPAKLPGPIYAPDGDYTHER